MALVAMAGGSAWGLDRCEPTRTTESRMFGDGEVPPPQVIADTFIIAAILSQQSPGLAQFWADTADKPDDLAALLADWQTDAQDRAAVEAAIPLLETLRTARTFVIAFEGPPADPAEAARRLTDGWPSHLAAIMPPETYREEFVAEAEARIRSGVGEYAAALMAAQAMRNRLDGIQGVPASALQAPENTFTMGLWDQSIRQQPVKELMDTLAGMPQGRAVLNEYLIYRQTVIGCAAVAMSGDAPAPAATAGRPAPSPVDDPEFSTVGFANRELLRAIYRGETDGIALMDVGLYLTKFAAAFYHADIEACRRVVGTATLARITGEASAGNVRDLVEGFTGAHQGRGGFEQGLEAGLGTFLKMLASDLGGEHDAQLFYDRHGCDSPVAGRFFDNLADFVGER